MWAGDISRQLSPISDQNVVLYTYDQDLEEVSIKWMDRPSVTEMERGGIYEMDGQKSNKKMEMQLKLMKYNNTL